MKNKNKSVLKELIMSAKERLKHRDYGNLNYNNESKKQDKIKTNQVLKFLASKEYKKADITFKVISNTEDELFNLLKRIKDEELERLIFRFENIKKLDIPILELPKIKERKLNPIVGGNRLK